MDAFAPDTFDGRIPEQHHVEDYYSASEQPEERPKTPEAPPPPEAEVWAEAVEAPSAESKKSSKSKLSREVERIVDQLYESTWNLKALKYLGNGSEEVREKQFSLFTHAFSFLL